METIELSIPDAIDALIEEEIDLQTIERVIEYVITHRVAWDHFERETLHCITSGIEINAKGIVENIRRKTKRETGSEFAIDNRYTAYLARIFERKHPEHKGFFERRKITGLTRVV